MEAVKTLFDIFKLSNVIICEFSYWNKPRGLKEKVLQVTNISLLTLWVR